MSKAKHKSSLDVIANDEFVRHCSNCGRVAALVSEEVDEVYWLKDTPKAGDFVVYFDPLDGSSNLDVNLSVGSIFSVVETKEALDPTDDASVLIRGSDQICAGYAIYGPSTALIITTGNGVNGFTHQQGTGEFRLTYRDMTIPGSDAGIRNQRVAPPLLGSASSEVFRRLPCGRRWSARRLFQHAVDGVNGGRSSPHPYARWRVSLPHRQCQSRSGRQAAPDVRGQPDGSGRENKRGGRPQPVISALWTWNQRLTTSVSLSFWGRKTKWH